MKLHCKTCRRRVRMHREQSRRLVGRGRDAYYAVTYTCLACGTVDQTKMYPNLLASVFSIPKGDLR